MGASRLKKVGHMIQQRLSSVLQMSVDDPRLALLSITEVSLTPDLRRAHVYYHVIGLSEPEQIAEVERAIERAKGFLRAELAKLSTLRFTPDLHFKYDDLSVKSAYLQALIQRANAPSVPLADGSG